VTPPLAEASVVASRAVTTTAREQVTAFLVVQPRAYCDACVARALGIDPSTAFRAAVKIARSDGFVRQYGACGECGSSRLVTGMAG
jgi:hypothetical protein